MIPMTLNADMRQDAWVIPYITTLPRQGSNVSYLHRQRCLHSRDRDQDRCHGCCYDRPVPVIRRESSGLHSQVKEYLPLKKVKRQINAFCLRHGYHYEKTKWTIAHLKWTKQLKMLGLYRETMDEYMASYDEPAAKIERFDSRIEEIAFRERYQGKVKKMVCFRESRLIRLCR